MRVGTPPPPTSERTEKARAGGDSDVRAKAQTERLPLKYHGQRTQTLTLPSSPSRPGARRRCGKASRVFERHPRLPSPELLARVRKFGFIDDYSGVRVSSSGRRFIIEGCTVHGFQQKKRPK